MLIDDDAFNERWQNSDSWNVCEERERLRFALVTLILSFFHLELFNLEALCSSNEIKI